jgi:DNA replication protein DnaC
MERHELLGAMDDLKRHGMRASFDEITGKGSQRHDELYPLLASLLRAQHNHRQARSIVYRMASAKFPVLKDLDAFHFADTAIDEGKVREIANCTFLESKRNAIFIGGTGKTHMVIAVVRSHARGGSTIRSIWSTNSSRKRPPVNEGGWPRSSCGTILS